MKTGMYLLLALVAVLQLLSFTSASNIERLAYRQSVEAEDREHNRPFGLRRPMRRLMAKLHGIGARGNPLVSVPRSSGSFGGSPVGPLHSNFQPSASSGGFDSHSNTFSSQSGGSSTPCAGTQGCGELTIPVASGGLDAPPGYDSAEDLFIFENLPPMMPFPNAANINPPISFSPGSFGSDGNSGYDPSGSSNFGSSQSSPSSPTVFGTPQQPSSAQNSQGSSFQPAHNQFTSPDSHSTNISPPSSSGSRVESVVPVLPSNVSPQVQASAVYESAFLNAVNGIKDFTLDLLSSFRALDVTGNIVFSPLSIASLLSLLNLGTVGNSNLEIEIALNLPDERTGVNGHQIYQQILDSANFKSEGLNITTSARIFMDQDISVKQTFLDDAHRYYNCSVSLENFSSRPGKARNRINRWVESQTEGKIRNFITSIPSSTRMIVANTVYFSGSWKTPFPHYTTTESDFNTGKKTIKVPLMTNLLEIPHYFSNVLNVDVAALPYTGDKYAMIIILPKESPSERSIEQLEADLDSFYMEELLRNLTMKQVSVSLPKMKLSMKMHLKDNLEQLRISSIFNGFNSDFSGLSDDKTLFVDQMLHEAVMEVTEKGTVAAGASGVMLDRIGGFPVVRVNKPAILYIADYENAIPLFWTRVVEPVPV